MGWTWSLAISQTTDSRSATEGPPCALLCFQRDVLAPVSLTAVELEMSRPMGRRGSVGLDYHVRLLPAAYVQGNPATRASWNGSRWQMPLDVERASTFGAGVEPLGLRLWAGSTEARFEAEAALGILAFLDPFLAGNATRANAVYEGGIGAQLSALRIGFRLRHISNAGLGEVNPGLDSQVIYVGWVF